MNTSLVWGKAQEGGGVCEVAKQFQIYVCLELDLIQQKQRRQLLSVAQSTGG